MALKDLYREYFKVGAACEKINGQFTRHEIGNPEKEALILKEFNSITCANELKPMYNCGIITPTPFGDGPKETIKNPNATEEYLPFSINPQAKEMLDWAKSNGMSMRGHVLVWHSQCPKEIFCKDYEPVTIPGDPELLKQNPMMKFFEKLNPVCFVSREVMLKRLESYISTLMDYMYANGYASTIYAWDVVNEAIELADKTPTGLRNSYWYQVIGDDFIYWAFRFAKKAVVECSEKYAAQYGVNAEDEAALKTIQPKLFYNDYNEWMPDKKAAIIAALQRSTDEHGSILGEGLIDGIGLQGHLSDNNDIAEFGEALRDYGKLVGELHVTELDVKCTCSNANQEYYQAVFYQKLFEEIMQAKKEGANITCVTFWGLTDDNSWIRDANPLLFHGDLTPKKSYDGVVFALTGESLGEPLDIKQDLSDQFYDFELAEGSETPVSCEELGFKMKGFGQMKITDETAHSGKWCLEDERRFGDWCGITKDISDFIGQTVEIGCYVKSAAKAIEINADFGGKFVNAARVETGSEDWVLLSGKVQIPCGIHAANIMFHVVDEAGAVSPLFIDELSVKLVGMEESFEGEQHIASVRGSGHLPFLSVVDNESRDGKGHSLRVIRQEKEATMKFNVSAYVGKKIRVSAFVKTNDKVIRLGLNGSPSVEYASAAAAAGEWTEISAVAEIPAELLTAELYIETDGNAEYYVDDIFVCLAE